MAKKKEEPKDRIMPNDLGTLLTKALNQLEVLEADKQYKVNMHAFHLGIGHFRHKKCLVCLAGALVDFYLNLTPHNTVDLDNYIEHFCNKCWAVNSLREGNIKEAADYLDIKLPTGIAEKITVVDYQTNKKKFKTTLRDLANTLTLQGI